MGYCKDLLIDAEDNFIWGRPLTRAQMDALEEFHGPRWERKINRMSLRLLRGEENITVKKRLTQNRGARTK